MTVCLLFSFHFWTGCIGIDFGYHWDEDKIIDSVKESVKTGVTLPGWYNYPSVCYDLALICAVPEAIDAAKAGKGDVYRMSSLIDISLSKPDFRLRVRRLYHFIVSLSIFWIFGLARKLRRSYVESVGIAALLAASWEFAYHARWIAPDAIMVQFGILTLMALAAFLQEIRQRKWAWLALAVVAAAFTCGTKYFGGIFLLPVCVVWWRSALPLFVSSQTAGFLVCEDTNKGGQTMATLQTKLLGLGIIFLLFFLVFLFTTPGAFVESLHFFYHIRYEMQHYATASGCNEVFSFSEHAYKLSQYLAFSALSPYTGIAAFCTVLSGLGIYDWAKKSKEEAFIFLTIPILFFVYICFQKLLIVRNDLLFIPFLALLTMRGMSFMQEKVTLYLATKPALSLGIKGGFYLIVLLFIGLNFFYLYKQADLIRNRSQKNKASDLQHYLHNTKTTIVYPSPATIAFFSQEKLAQYPNISFSPQNATHYLFLSSEYNYFPANTKGIYTIIPASPEVNFDFYPNWKGEPRFVLIDIKRQKEVQQIDN